MGTIYEARKTFNSKVQPYANAYWKSVGKQVDNDTKIIDSLKKRIIYLEMAEIIADTIWIDRKKRIITWSEY